MQHFVYPHFFAEFAQIVGAKSGFLESESARGFRRYGDATDRSCYSLVSPSWSNRLGP
jgi:hypothetical protein